MPDDNLPNPLIQPTHSESPTTRNEPAPGRLSWRRLFGKSAPAPANHHPPVDSTREVVETIVFVVVLVLLLKSFVAEAFVIPTGSMAETLWGYQKVIKCPECDILFPVNCSSEVEANDGRFDKVTSCVCPNCFKQIYLDSARVTPPGATVIPDPGPTSGDRVLVGKFLYDLLDSNPRRLDVVVFKYPGNSSRAGMEPGFPHSGPFKNYVPMNYIKRLIGIEGETIAICRGKIYVLSAEESPKYDDLKEATTPKEREQLRNQLWEYDYMHVDDPAAAELFRQGKFTMLRKAPEHLLAMMRLVYDNDHPAKDLTAPQYRRWRGEDEKAWLPEAQHGFRHTAAGEQDVAWLRYHQHTRNDDKDSLIHPFMGYNPPGDRTSEELNYWVGDLVQECEVTVDKPEGELVMELSKGPDRFQAHWNLADGTCSLQRITTEKEGRGVVKDELGKTSTALKGGTHRLRFANVDQRLTIWVDGKLVFGDGVPYNVPAPPQWTENDYQPSSIGVKGASVQIKHLKLFHDTYYSINKAANDGAREAAVMTMYVQPDHFLCLGDNSFHSSDSRTWGTVPRRLMLGKAVLVYYPFYFPWWPLYAQVNRVGLIH